MPHDVPQVIRVVRTKRTCTYLWDRQPRGVDRKIAEQNDPPNRRRVGHCWPGFDDSLAPGSAFVGTW
jgi:hypothetical protein